MLLCVDNGYGKTKVKTNNRLYMFDSKVQTAINNDGTIIQLNGIDYQIGTGQDDICLDKSNSLVHQLCLLKTIAENTSDNEEVRLILDLPLTHYYNQECRNQFKESVYQYKTIKYNGKLKTVNVVKVEACPQGLSSLYAYGENQYKNKIIGVLDIGSLTVDGCIVNDLKPIKETIFSINLGTLILENKIKTALNQEFMLNIQDYEMPYIIKNGLSNIQGADMVIQNCIEEYFNSLKREMMAKNWSVETIDVLGIGGGSILLNDMLSLHFKYTQSNNPIYDNVLGLWNIGERL